MFNYQLKQLQGQQSQQLLTTTYEFSWQHVQQLAQAGHYDELVLQSKQALTRRLANEILDKVAYTETPQEDALQLRFRVYVHSPNELQELLGKAYDLGANAVKPRPNYSNKEIS